MRAVVHTVLHTFHREILYNRPNDARSLIWLTLQKNRIVAFDWLWKKGKKKEEKETFCVMMNDSSVETGFTQNEK